MNSRNRNFLILGIVAVVLVFGVILFLVLFRGEEGGLVGETPSFPSSGETGGFGGGGTGTSGQGEAPSAGREVAPNLVKIADGPVALGAFAEATVYRETFSDGSTSTPEELPIPNTLVHFVERISGNVYTYDTHTMKSTRVTNDTLPAIQEAVWSKDGSYAVLRFLSRTDSGSEQLESFVLPVNDPEGGYFLESGVSDVVMTGSSTLVTLLTNSNGSIATAAGVDGSSPRTLFTSLLSSLRIIPAGGGFIAYTKASKELDGYAFVINSAGVSERLAGPERGLTALPSPSGAQVVLGYLSGTAARADVINATTRARTALPIAAIPEKCAWTADEKTLYCAVPRSLSRDWPDSWYQGATSFSDRIWKIDMEARVAVLVVDPETVADTAIDAVALTVDAKNDTLVFTNKRDGSLWAYDL